MRIFISFLSGFVMGIGLIISQMINPAKVIGFLDVFGHFDPTLAFVMLGALIVAALGFRIFSHLGKPCLAETFDTPTKTKVDSPLIFGAAIFGIGWGLAGFCPGPALVSITLGLKEAGFFVLAMLVGMLLAKQIKIKS